MDTMAEPLLCVNCKHYSPGLYSWQDTCKRPAEFFDLVRGKRAWSSTIFCEEERTSVETKPHGEPCGPRAIHWEAKPA